MSKIEILKVSNTKREKETSTVSLSNLLQKPDRIRPYRHRPHDLFKCPVRRPSGRRRRRLQRRSSLPRRVKCADSLGVDLRFG